MIHSAPLGLLMVSPAGFFPLGMPYPLFCFLPGIPTSIPDRTPGSQVNHPVNHGGNHEAPPATAPAMTGPA